MVAPKENLLSLGHQINMEQHTFRTISMETQKEKTLNLLQHCQEMQEGVIRAQQHNRQLLQQFKEAQDTLEDMLTLTAAMKTTRMEYEKHLVGNPQWRQQPQENAWEKRNLNNITDRTSSSLGQLLPAQIGYNGPFHSPHAQSSWPVLRRNPHYPQDSTHVPSHLPQNPLQLYHQSLRCQKVPEQPWIAAAGTTCGPEAQFCITEPTARSGRHSQMSSAPSPYKKSAGSRNRPSDGSDSTTESSQVSGKQRGKLKHTPDGERHSSSDFQAAGGVMTGMEAAQISGSAASAETRSTMKNARADGGPLKVGNRVKESNKKNEDSQQSSEEGEQTGREESEAQREMSGSIDIWMTNEGKNEEVKDDEKLQKEAPKESDENVVDAEKQERKEKDISQWNNITDEEENAEAEEEIEEQESEEEESDGVRDNDNRKLDSTNTRSSEEEVDAEDLSEEDEASDENNKTQDEEGMAKKKHEETQGEDESDSDECIISLQKSKRLHIIPEEAREDDKKAQPANSEEDSDEFNDDIKNSNTQGKGVKHEQKPKGRDHDIKAPKVETEEGSSQEDQPSDSDEFDHFFD